ncbi:MAG: hypothetical protein QXG91_04865 [Candidatus Aenigmatarchaeota archaeon]
MSAKQSPWGEELNELLNFIENNPPEKEYWYFYDWEKKLTENIPNWKELINDENNWDKIKNVKARENNDDLWECFINAVGADLLNYCLVSSDDDLRVGAKSWLDEKFINKLDYIHPALIDLWKKLNEFGKRYVIDEVFERFSGELFEWHHRYLRYLEEIIDRIIYYSYDLHAARHLARLLGLVPLVAGYIPSREILNLRDLIEKSGDEYFLKIVDEKIEERKKACELLALVNHFFQFPYDLNRDEKELIARAIDKFRRNGYSTAPLPKIYLSYETPPLFVAYPELEDELEEIGRRERKEEPVIPRNRERGRPETISIEEVLGCYVPAQQKIILYARGINWFAKKYGIEENLLRMVVLLHEIGHWITHLLPKPDVSSWPTEFFIETSEEVTEGWAQLITYWVVDEIGGKIKNVFEKLNRCQSSIYHVYRNFIGENIDSVIGSLKELRKLNRPATLDDWEGIVKSK